MLQNDTKIDSKGGQGATEGNAEACSLQAAKGNRPSNEGIQIKCSLSSTFKLNLSHFKAQSKGSVYLLTTHDRII